MRAWEFFGGVAEVVVQRGGSRATLFAQLDRPALKPLPATRYQFGQWETARVNIEYHIDVERHYYSEWQSPQPQDQIGRSCACRRRFFAGAVLIGWRLFRTPRPSFFS